MTAPDRDAIRAALILGIHAVEAANYADDFVVDAEMDSVVATVAALMEQYAEDYAARAVVADLPTADVSRIGERVQDGGEWGTIVRCHECDGQGVLHRLDAQAAAHAAELHGTVTTEYHNRMMNQAGAACEVLRAERDAASAEVEALRAEVERLRGKWMDGYRAGRADECAAAEAEVEAAEDARVQLATEAYTAPDADWDTIIDSLRARIGDALADRDAYAAEKVRAALLDAAKAIEACYSDDPGYNVGCRDAAGYLRALAGAS